jgi:hypothetical protein
VRYGVPLEVKAGGCILEGKDGWLPRRRFPMLLCLAAGAACRGSAEVQLSSTGPCMHLLTCSMQCTVLVDPSAPVAHCSRLEKATLAHADCRCPAPSVMR